MAQKCHVCTAKAEFLPWYQPKDSLGPEYGNRCQECWNLVSGYVAAVRKYGTQEMLDELMGSIKGERQC